MATLQIQRTRDVVTVAETAIDQKQSVEVVQTILHSGLSCLMFMRNLFPQRAFKQQIYEMSETIHSYSDYAGGKLQKNVEKAAQPRTVMQVLQRNRSKRVDMFLDWLENGAFTALKACHLRAVQVAVHADPEHRDKVFETYTFSIEYARGADNAKVVAGLEMDSPGGPPVSVTATNAAMQYLLREIMKICEAMPNLPEKRFVSMALFYTHNAEKVDQPKGFVADPGNRFLFAEAETWEKRTENSKTVTLGFHNTSLKISHVKQVIPNALAGLRPYPFPVELNFCTGTSRYEDIEYLNIEGSPSKPTEDDQKSRKEALRRQPVAIFKPHHEHRETDPMRKAPVKKQTVTPALTSDVTATKPNVLENTRRNPNRTRQIMVVSTPQLEYDVNNTQSSNVVGMKQAFQSMMQPENITQGDTQAPTQLWPPVPGTSSTESPTQSDSSTEKSTDTLLINKVKPVLSFSVATKLNARKLHLRDSARELAKAAGLKSIEDDIVLCQCGFTEEEGDMVKCRYCDTRQHLHCYGYTSGADLRRPDEHACYQCLSTQSEGPVLATLRDLALKRRAMYYALTNGLGTKREFYAYLGVEPGAGSQIHQHLKNQRYVTAPPGAHHAGYAASGKPHLVAVTTGPNHDKMLENLFNPMMHISNCYEIPSTPATQSNLLTQRLLSTQADSMGPPATPAQWLRKNGAATPASGLDLRSSLTPFETPSQPRTRPAKVAKRPVDKSEENEVLPKRRWTRASAAKCPMSVQTEFLLDACGVPSSPSAPLQKY